jgi:hypothetical protein
MAGDALLVSSGGVLISRESFLWLQGMQLLFPCLVGHHLDQVRIAQFVSDAPSDAQNDD